MKAIKLILNIFKRKQYEIYLFEGNQIMVSRDVARMQKEGWELAGEITTSFSGNNMPRMLVPLKRLIK